MKSECFSYIPPVFRRPKIFQYDFYGLNPRPQLLPVTACLQNCFKLKACRCTCRLIVNQYLSKQMSDSTPRTPVPEPHLHRHIIHPRLGILTFDGGDRKDARSSSGSSLKIRMSVLIRRNGLIRLPRS
jgi:hypothetical protein